MGVYKNLVSLNLKINLNNNNDNEEKVRIKVQLIFVRTNYVCIKNN